MRNRIHRVLAALAITGLLAACGGSDAPPTEVSKTIGAAGGTLDGPDGVQLIVPPGAMAQDTVLKIARLDTGSPALPPGVDAMTPVYEFTPHGQLFQLPVTVRLPMANTAGVEFEDALMASPGEPWQAMRATVSGGFAQWQRMSLSYAAGTACAIKAGDRDPYPCNWPSIASNLSAMPAAGLTDRGGAGDARRWTVDQAVDLNGTIWLRAAPDCTAAQYIVRRFFSGAKDTVLVDWTPVTMNPDPANAKKILGVVNFNTRIDADWNGRPAIGIGFRCTRLYDGRTMTSGYGHYMVVSAPIAPPPPPLPVITSHPADLEVMVGDPASFNVVASASGTLAIAWERSDDGGTTWAGTGATGATLSIANALIGDDGARFRANVCNVVGASQRCLHTGTARLTVTAPAGDVVAYAWDFDGDEIVAAGVERSLQALFVEDSTLWDGEGFKGLGPVGNQFGGYLWRMPTGKTLQLSLSLPPHSALSIEFLLAAIDSLDGSGSFPAGDVLRIEVDGVVVFRESFANAEPTQVQSYVPPPGGELARRVDLGFTRGGFYLDSAYNMALEPRLKRIPHTRDRALITFTFESEGAQPLADESWGMDNLKVILHP
jgi:hypothetical protein